MPVLLHSTFRNRSSFLRYGRPRSFSNERSVRRCTRAQKKKKGKKRSNGVHTINFYTSARIDGDGRCFHRQRLVTLNRLFERGFIEITKRCFRANANFFTHIPTRSVPRELSIIALLVRFIASFEISTKVRRTHRSVVSLPWNVSIVEDGSPVTHAASKIENVYSSYLHTRRGYDTCAYYARRNSSVADTRSRGSRHGPGRKKKERGESVESETSLREIVTYDNVNKFGTGMYSPREIVP